MKTPPFFRTLAAFGIAALFVWQSVLGFPQFQWNLSAPMLEPNKTVEEKLHGTWGMFYDVIQFVRKHTSKDAVILIDSDYLYYNLMLYFLYPRQLLFGGEALWRVHPEIDYVLITKDYPSFPVSGERLMLDEQYGLMRVAR